MAFLSLIPLVSILLTTSINAMNPDPQQANQPAKIQKKLNTFLIDQAQEKTDKNNQENERIKILEDAFKSIKKAPPKGTKKLSATQLHAKVLMLPYDLQQHIARMWLKVRFTNTVTHHTKELLPALLDHTSINDPDDTIFTSISWAEHMGKRMIDLIKQAAIFQHHDYVAALYCSHSDIERDQHTHRALKEMEKSRVLFTGIQQDKDAFIMHMHVDGSTRFFVNVTNRALVHQLNLEQLHYLITLFDAPNKQKYAQKNSRIHHSLPSKMQDLVEENYGLSFTTSCTCR